MQRELAALILKDSLEQRKKPIVGTEIYGNGKKYLVTTTVEKQKESTL